jgi:hypothetical protein
MPISVADTPVLKTLRILPDIAQKAAVLCDITRKRQTTSILALSKAPFAVCGRSLVLVTIGGFSSSSFISPQCFGIFSAETDSAPEFRH